MEEMHRTKYGEKECRASMFSKSLTLPSQNIFTNPEALQFSVFFKFLWRLHYISIFD